MSVSSVQPVAMPNAVFCIVCNFVTFAFNIIGDSICIFSYWSCCGIECFVFAFID